MQDMGFRLAQEVVSTVESETYILDAERENCVSQEDNELLDREKRKVESELRCWRSVKTG